MSYHSGLRQLQNSFVTDEDLRGRNILHLNCCPATCWLKNQSFPQTGYVCYLVDCAWTIKHCLTVNWLYLCNMHSIRSAVPILTLHRVTSVTSAITWSPHMVLFLGKLPKRVILYMHIHYGIPICESAYLKCPYVCTLILDK